VLFAESVIAPFVVLKGLIRCNILWPGKKLIGGCQTPD